MTASTGLRVAVVERHVPNHYLAANAVAKIYASDPRSRVDVFTTPAIGALMARLGEKDNIVRHERPDDTLAAVLERVANGGFDRLHLVSVFSEYRDVRVASLGIPTYLGIHNIDQWFFDSLWHRLALAVRQSKLALDRHVLYNLRRTLPRLLQEGAERVRIRDEVLAAGGRLVVYGPNVARHILTYADPSRVVLVPFAVHEGIADAPPPTIGRLRVCIPGIVTEARRRYVALLGHLAERQERLAGGMELDLLGKLQSEPPILSAIQRLRERGWTIHSYDRYLGEEEFAHRLQACDIVLGNFDPAGAYGSNTETGVLFNMIRGAKPGMLPAGFPNFPELRSSTLAFGTLAEIPTLLESLLDEPARLEALKAEAQRNAREFLPTRFLSALL